MTLPNFLGIGAPKAGTTWLARCLQEHPSIYLPSLKEVNFLVYPNIDGRLQEYEAHFEQGKGKPCIGEFTTKYLASELPAPRVRALMPEAKIIVCLRNPPDQIYSYYWHLARQNFHQREPQKKIGFEQALTKYSDMLKKPAHYWDNIQYWLKYIDANQLLVLLFDDIEARPDFVLRQTYEFLGVDATFTPKIAAERGSAVRQGTSPKSALAHKVHARLYTAMSRHVYQPLKRAIGVGRADRVKEVLRIRPLMESLFFRKGYPPMKSSTRKMLVEEYAHQVRGVEQFLGKSLESWK